MSVWVNVFLHPYDRKRFYINATYPTKEEAITGLGKGAKGRKTQTYIDTIEIKLNYQHKLEL